MPPEPGKDVASSLHTKPSARARTAPTTHPSSACGPPRAPSMSGKVTNVPLPIMLHMSIEVALSKPSLRSSRAVPSRKCD